MTVVTVWVFTLMMYAETNTTARYGVAAVVVPDLADRESCMALKREWDKQGYTASTCVPVRRVIARG